MGHRLVVVANRLPLARVADGWEESPGGLVGALTPLLRRHGGLWVGWSGMPDERIDPFRHDGMDLVSVPMSRDEAAEHYHGHCNETIWPLYHDAIRTSTFSPVWWRSYSRMNDRFAAAAARVAGGDDLIWIHDYHLQLVPQMLRDRLPRAQIQFFLHIPFPPIEVFARLPWRTETVRGLLGADVLGFQTERAARNFEEAATEFAGAVVTPDGVEAGERQTRTLAAPISIDVADFERISRSPETAERVASLRRALGDPHRIVLGVDRLDYTKGIDVRLEAFETLLERRPSLAASTRFVQIAVPSRESTDGYGEMREHIERITGRINGAYGGRHDMPVHYIYASLPRDELVAYYRTADVMCVTPLADGMNLVAKEYVASRVDCEGVLLLSEFTGASPELTDAVLVNPYDIDGVAISLENALAMGAAERRRRMQAMRNGVHRHDVHAWLRQALAPISRGAAA